MPVSLTEFAFTLLLGLAVALVVIVAAHLVLTLLARRWPIATDLSRAVGRPFRLFLVVLVVAAVGDGSRPDLVPSHVWDGVALVLRLSSIAAVAWLVGAALIFIQDLGLRRYSTDVADNRTARRIRTQVLVVRRITIAAVVLVAVSVALLSFPGVQAFGASLLASAGLVSVVAAVAAQSTLANVFAGIQLAFSDTIRIDDVVVVEGEFGKIEEITLGYVVVHLWDDRRLVVPATYFAKEPFENWTRRNSELVGTVELDLDWRIDIDGLRSQLDTILAASDLWDGRKAGLQVTDAVGGVVRVRVVVTAADASTLFDLRCAVREELIGWARRHDDAGLPRQRVELVSAQAG